MTLFGQYLTELCGKNIIESDIGFITYSFLEDSVYIEDLFVLPDHRKTSEASKMADEVSEIARSKGYKKLMGSVIPANKNSTESLKVLLAYGFKLDSSTTNFILMKKDLV